MADPKINLRIQVPVLAKVSNTLTPTYEHQYYKNLNWNLFEGDPLTSFRIAQAEESGSSSSQSKTLIHVDTYVINWDKEI